MDLSAGQQPHNIVSGGCQGGTLEPNCSFNRMYAQHDVKWIIHCILLMSLLINLILMSVIIVLSVRRQETLAGHPIIRVDSCPDGWIGFQRRCYYFAEVDRNWTSSQMECASFNASLVVINSQEEMDFIKRYKTFADHWIGLQRNLDTEPWKWIDGTLFSNWFEVRGRGECGYMNHKSQAPAAQGKNDGSAANTLRADLRAPNAHHLSSCIEMRWTVCRDFSGAVAIIGRYLEL